MRRPHNSFRLIVELTPKGWQAGETTGTNTMNLTPSQTDALMSEACDKMNELYAERDALKSLLTELATAVGDMDTSYKTSDFLPGVKSRRYFKALDNAKYFLSKQEGSK